MSMAAVAVIAGAIFLWGAFSARLQHLDVTAAIMFVTTGALLASIGDQRPTAETIKVMAEVTLVLVLFSDAARVRIADLRADLGLYVRLLGVGLPLTIALGAGAAYVMFPDGGVWAALLIGAALAPTDAALGASLMSNPAVPARIRRLINVESGLNDGIATPFVMLAIAGLSSAGHGAPLDALTELALGVLVGAGAGGVGGELLRRARGRGWSAEGFAGPAVLGLALCAYATAVAVDGNGFIAAFVGGAAFGNLSGRENERLVPFVEESGGLASLIVWLMFGAVAVVPAVEDLTWQVLGYALLSLTAVRMIPVALACVGTGLGRATIAFTGWFGPRGLASVIFALLALEELGTAAGPALTVITITVLLSVVAHGVTAGPLANRYGTHLAANVAAPEHAPAPEPRLRALTRRGRP
ncbi:cation:proton antiporter [Spirillospora sp. NPDC047279]|uniref:cation:proton antiporter domain-containing protein n=1 Tax=Spirillospora sp. NPDC047279 TaxID=3155478 RepID=UPI0033E31E87